MVARGLGCALALLLICGSAIWLWPRPAGAPSPLVTGLALNRGGAPDGPFELQSAQVALLWTGPAVPAASITVADTTGTAHAVRVWWILSSQGDETPWVNPLLESVHVQTNVSAHGSATLSVPAAIGARLPANGSYVLTLWAHTVQPNGSDVPSDGVSLASPITVSGAAADVEQNVIDPAASVLVTAIDPPARVRAGSTVTVASSIGTSGAQQVSVEIEATATDRTGAVVHSAPEDLVLDPGPTVEVPAQLTLPAGWTGKITFSTVASMLLPDGAAVPAVTGMLTTPIALARR